MGGGAKLRVPTPPGACTHPRFHAYLGKVPDDSDGAFAGRFLFSQLNTRAVSALDVWNNALALEDVREALKQPSSRRSWRGRGEAQFRVMPFALRGAAATGVSSAIGELNLQYRINACEDEAEALCNRFGGRAFRDAKKHGLAMNETVAALRAALGRYAPSAPDLATVDDAGATPHVAVMDSRGCPDQQVHADHPHEGTGLALGCASAWAPASKAGAYLGVLVRNPCAVAPAALDYGDVAEGHFLRVTVFVPFGYVVVINTYHFGTAARPTMREPAAKRPCVLEAQSTNWLPWCDEKLWRKKG